MKYTIIIILLFSFFSCSKKEITLIYKDCKLTIKGEEDNLFIAEVRIYSDSSVFTATIDNKDYISPSIDFCLIDTNIYSIHKVNEIDFKDNTSISLHLNVSVVEDGIIYSYGYYHVSMILKDTTIRLNQMMI